MLWTTPDVGEALSRRPGPGALSGLRVHTQQDREFVIPGIPSSSRREVLLVSTYLWRQDSLGGRHHFLNPSVNIAYRDMLQRVQARRPANERGHCVFWVGADIDDEFYGLAHTLARHGAQAHNLAVREVKLGRGTNRFNVDDFRIALRECEVLNLGGGKPARFARNIRYLKQDHPDLFRELTHKIETGQMMVFANSAGAYVVGKTGANWLEDPDEDIPSEMTRNEAEQHLKLGTLDLIGPFVPKPHFKPLDGAGRLSVAARRMSTWLQDNASFRVLCLADNEAERMDFFTVTGNRGRFRPSGESSTALIIIITCFAVYLVIAGLIVTIACCTAKKKQQANEERETLLKMQQNYGGIDGAGYCNDGGDGGGTSGTGADPRGGNDPNPYGGGGGTLPAPSWEFENNPYGTGFGDVRNIVDDFPKKNETSGGGDPYLVTGVPVQSGVQGDSSGSSVLQPQEDPCVVVSGVAQTSAVSTYG
eukprot:g17634.t1